MIRELRAAGVIGVLDDHFARVLRRLVPEAPEEVLGAAALTSHLAESGHVCLVLSQHAGRVPRDADGQPLGVRWPALEAWTEALRNSALVVRSDVAEISRDKRPLVLDGHGRLYLYRFWRHEDCLAARIRKRLETAPPDLDPALLRDGLSRLFGSPLSDDSKHDAAPGDGQRLAALLALTRPFCVVTGGPGTGKTSTVVKILALLQEQALASHRPLELTLLAPTGKAAARLSASIKEAKAGLDCAPEVRDAIPEEAMTIHRRLGTRHFGVQPFVHNADNPIPTDGVLVDEASMVDLALMSHLVAAVPPGARLILMGDREQLASVAPGSVLADICNAGETPGYSHAMCERLQEQTGDHVRTSAETTAETGIWDSIAHLTHSFRFGAHSGIGELARAISAGDAEAALAVLRDEQYADVRRVDADSDTGRATLVKGAVAAYAPFVSGGEPADRLEALARFRVLCAHRTGSAGVETVNLAIEERLRRDGLLASPPNVRSYAGRPILVTANSYRLGLFNGDVGVLLSTDDAGLRAHFVDPDGRTRTFAPARLPDHETVFAMTVHKSQGSEFDDVVLLLPDRPSRVLSRELLYTAVTRARKSVTIHATADVFREAVSRRAERASGLRDLLWEG